jgi:hypothetical protein
MDAVEAGRRLAERHVNQAEPDPARSLLNYAEAPHRGDWTLRAALVRLAQPHPVRVGSLLDLMRRLDAPLQHVRRSLERHTVTCDRALTVDGLASPPVAPYPDVRASDLARLVATGVDASRLLTGYEEAIPLADEERLAVPLLAVAVAFEQLAATLTAWALVGPAAPPVQAVDRTCAEVAARLDELGVPVEAGPPPGAGWSSARARRGRG